MFMAKELVRPGRLGPVGLLPGYLMDVLTMAVFDVLSGLIIAVSSGKVLFLTFCANICSWILKTKFNVYL